MPDTNVGRSTQVAKESIDIRQAVNLTAGQVLLITIDGAKIAELTVPVGKKIDGELCFEGMETDA